ncbi:MAG TPA: DNA polymerase III subunit delta [Sedimentisphaerales bacterium]|nr:DNA polymerase III subunit delta [Sedimentisphaerales bacterium]
MDKARADKKWAPIYVIAGKDDALVNAECDKLLGRLLEPEQRATGLFNVEPKEVELVDIFDELRTLPFLADKRVVLVRGADKFISENREPLEDYFDKPSPTGILILTASSWEGRTKLAKKLTKVGKLISITQPKPWQLPERLVRYARDAHDKNLTKEAAELLIELTGDELGRLYGEIDKLAVFANEQKTITASHVESLIGHNRFFNAFAVIDAVAAGSVAQAVDRLRTMFAEDKSTEYTVVGAFAYHFRRMFNAKLLLQEGRHSTDEIANRLRIYGDRDRFFSQLRRMPLKKIGDVLQQLADIDYAIKTGRTKAQVAIEQLVLKLAASSAGR